MRKDCLLKVECVADDQSEFAMVFVVDGEVVKERTEFSFDDVLISLYDFYKDCCDSIGFDSRYDRLVIDCRYAFDFCE